MAKQKRKRAKPKKVKDNKSLDKKQRVIYKLLPDHPRFGLFLGPGSGKTRIILRWMLTVLKKRKRVNALIVTTKANAIDTWPAQLNEQMDATGIHLSMHVTHKEYKQVTVPGKNCQYSARIIVCTYESLRKLLWHYDNQYFDFLIVDESVRIKSWRAKATSIIFTFSQQCKYVYPLSGLPAPNKIVDLFTQVFLIDGGERLGTNITAFRRQFLEQSAYSRFVWNVKGYPNVKKMERTKRKILKKIKDVCVTEDTETFVKRLPDVKFQTVDFELKRGEQKRYNKFEKKSIFEIDEKDFTAVNQAVLRMKLLQFISGNLYEDLDVDTPKSTAKRKYKRTTKQRMRALDQHLRKTYKPGNKLIISYGFRHSIPDIMRVLQRHVGRGKVFIVDGSQSTTDLRKRWDKQEIDVVVSFAGSIAEGLNLQSHGGSIIFYSLMYNYNHFHQLVARIRRRGNPFNVVDVFIINCLGTADELVASSIRGKAELGREVMSAAKLIDILKRKARAREKLKRAA